MVFWICVVALIISFCVSLMKDDGVILIDEYDDIYVTNCGTITLCIGALVLVMMGFIFMSRIDERKNMEVNQQIYKTLSYKVKEYPSLQNKFDLHKSEIIDQVYEYNVNKAIYEARSENFWIGIFYGRNLYNNCEYIRLDDINLN